MKTILLAGLAALLLVSGNSSSDTPTISIAEIIDDQGDAINYDGNYKTNIEDAELIRRVEIQSTHLAHAGICYNCSSARDIQITDMLNYIEFVSYKYCPKPLEEYKKSTFVTLNRKSMEHIIQSEFGIADGLDMYGGTVNDIEYTCNLAQSNMNVGLLPIELWREGEYIDITGLIIDRGPTIRAAMKYRFKLVDDALYFVSATRLAIREQSGGNA